MMTDSFPTTEPLGLNQDLRASSNYDQSVSVPPVPSWHFGLGLYRDNNPIPVVFRQLDPIVLSSTIAELRKIERQHQERLAAVALDQTALKLLDALNQETSVRWGDLPEIADCEWSEASRSAALLVGANLCEVSPTRIRLNEYGDKLLAESSPANEALPEVAD